MPQRSDPKQSCPPTTPLPQVVWVECRGSVLHPTPLAGDPTVLGLNLTRGCVHRCAFCSVRASPKYPGDSEVLLYANTAERLEVDLAHLEPPPRAVYISPATDPFPPMNTIQDEVAGVVRVLAQRGVEAWLMTRGLIRPLALATLTEYRQQVKVTVALTTLDRTLQRRLEPLAAPPSLRLKQMGELTRREIPVKVAIEPLIPGITDTQANLSELLRALAGLGVRHVMAGYMFLREGIREQLKATLDRNEDDLVCGAYRNGPILTTEGLAAARYLPRGRRQRGYATLMALGSQHGIRVSVCGLTNPDFVLARTPVPQVPST